MSQADLLYFIITVVVLFIEMQVKEKVHLQI